MSMKQALIVGGTGGLGSAVVNVMKDSYSFDDLLVI